MHIPESVYNNNLDPSLRLWPASLNYHIDLEMGKRNQYQEIQLKQMDVYGHPLSQIDD